MSPVDTSCDPIPFFISAGAGDLSEDAGCPIAHLMVTNPTNQNLFLPDAPDVVPPGTFGKIVPVRSTRIVRASWTVPPNYGISQPVASGGLAIVSALPYGAPALPHPGTTLPLVTAGKALGRLDVPLGQGTSIDVAMPTSCSWLRLNIFSGSLLELTVQGDQTGTIYLDQTGIAADQLGGLFGCFITEAADTSVTVSGVAAAMSEASIRISAEPSAGSVDPPAWEFPNQMPFANGFPAGNGQVVVAGSHGRQLRIFTGELVIRTAGAAGTVAVLRDGAAGTTIVRANAAVLGTTNFDRQGAAITVGNDLVVDVPPAAVLEVGLAFSRF